MIVPGGARRPAAQAASWLVAALGHLVAFGAGGNVALVVRQQAAELCFELRRRP